VDATALLIRRLGAQGLLAPRRRDPVGVTEDLLAIQGQDPRGARLAIRVRSVGVSAADVDRAMSAERSLLISWLNRGTLHLVCSEDYPWLQMLTSPRTLSANARRLAQEGVTPRLAERGVEVIVGSLGAEGPLTRAQLRARLDSASVPTERQALVHLLILASLRGLIVRGPILEGQHAFVLVVDWLERRAPPQREAALAELARRYLRGHGPANERDLAKWAGLTLGECRAGLEAIAAELVIDQQGLVDLAARPAATELPAPRLLGAFDPVLHGWRSAREILGPHVQLITTNGLFRPFAMVEGRAVATWKIVGAEVELEALQPISAAVRAELLADAELVRAFLFGPR
jgi:Winged helix DNA-binding domain